MIRIIVKMCQIEIIKIRVIFFSINNSISTNFSLYIFFPTGNKIIHVRRCMKISSQILLYFVLRTDDKIHGEVYKRGMNLPC